MTVTVPVAPAVTFAVTSKSFLYFTFLGADAVVVVARPGDDRAAALLRAHADTGAHRPIAVEVWPETAAAATSVPDAVGIRALSAPTEIRALLRQLVGPDPRS
jgi:hypothetical protein